MPALQFGGPLVSPGCFFFLAFSSCRLGKGQTPMEKVWSKTHRIHGAGIYANMTGVYWWDPCYHIYIAYMDPMGNDSLKTGEHAWNVKGSALRIDVKSAIPARSQVLLALAAHKCCLLCHFYPIASIFANLYIYTVYIYTRIIITIQTFIYCVVLHTSIWNKEPFST